MTSTAYVSLARDWARTLEDREAARTGQRLPVARKAVSRRVAVPTGTLQNLRKNRLKAIAAHWYARLHAGVIRELEAELRYLEHELTILRQQGIDPRSDETSAVVADIAKVRQALGLTAPHKGER